MLARLQIRGHYRKTKFPALKVSSAFSTTNPSYKNARRYELQPELLVELYRRALLLDDIIHRRKVRRKEVPEPVKSAQKWKKSRSRISIALTDSRQRRRLVLDDVKKELHELRTQARSNSPTVERLNRHL